VAPPPPCRVDHEAADGDVLDFAGGAVVLHVGATPRAASRCICLACATCSPAISSPSPRGNVIVGPFNTDRDQSRRFIGRLAGTGARIAGFGHGEAVLIGAAQRLAHCTYPLA
jgi:hypothetical protein